MLFYYLFLLNIISLKHVHQIHNRSLKRSCCISNCGLAIYVLLRCSIEYAVVIQKDSHSLHSISLQHVLVASYG
jgi:hypothetical protein